MWPQTRAAAIMTADLKGDGAGLENIQVTSFPKPRSLGHPLSDARKWHHFDHEPLNPNSGSNSSQLSSIA